MIHKHLRGRSTRPFPGRRQRQAQRERERERETSRGESSTSALQEQVNRQLENMVQLTATNMIMTHELTTSREACAMNESVPVRMYMHVYVPYTCGYIHIYLYAYVDVHLWCALDRRWRRTFQSTANGRPGV